jgi:hypothetical protein
MDANFKKKWVEALRSGSYKQAQYGLQRDGGFCCLGVLCDIYDNTGWKEQTRDGYTTYTLGGQDEQTWLPDAIRDKLEIPRDAIGTLVEMNDRDNLKFGQIADYIDKNL